MSLGGFIWLPHGLHVSHATEVSPAVSNAAMIILE
jgi:hypothetical protein